MTIAHLRYILGTAHQRVISGAASPADRLVDGLGLLAFTALPAAAWVGFCLWMYS